MRTLTTPQVKKALHYKFGQTVISCGDDLWIDDPSVEAHEYLLKLGYRKVEGKELEESMGEYDAINGNRLSTKYILYRI